MTKKENTYEQELRKLLTYDENIDEPVSLFGFDMTRMTNVARNMFPSEFEHMSDKLLRTLTQETLYCALERIAILTLSKARKELDYEGDNDRLVLQTKIRLKRRLRNLSYFKRKGMGEQLEKVADYITMLSLFLYFGAELRLNKMNNTPSLFGKLNHKEKLAGLVEELFPRAGFSHVKIFSDNKFVDRFLSYAQGINMELSTVRHRNNAIFTLNIINPSPDSIKKNNLWFIALSDSREELCRMLSACIAVDSENYIRLATAEFDIEMDMRKNDEEKKKKKTSELTEKSKLEKASQQCNDNQKVAEELINDAIADIEAKDKEIDELKSRSAAEYQKVREQLKKIHDLTIERDALAEEVKALRSQINAGEQFYGDSDGESLLQRISRCFYEGESTYEDANNMQEWMKIERDALALFSNVPEICTIIRRLRHERAERKSAESKRQSQGNRTITITNNHGPIITGDAVRKTKTIDGTTFTNPDAPKLITPQTE